MSVVYRVVKRVSNPLKADSPKKFYPQAITMGKSVDLKFMAQKMRDSSSLSVGDIKSALQTFVEKLKEQLLEGKTVNIEGLGVFMLSIRSKGEEKQEDVTATSASSVRVCFQASKDLRVSKIATRAEERLDLISLEDYLKGIGLSTTPLTPGEGEPENPFE
ncbi:MAG: HU family DNA-binding protein [Bacteroides sp.]